MEVKRIERVNFCVGIAPAVDPPALCKMLNWLYDNEFKCVGIVSSFAIDSSPIAKPGSKTAQGMPVVLVYASCSKRRFKEYFGFDYSLDRLADVSAAIGKDAGVSTAA